MVQPLNFTFESCNLKPILHADYLMIERYSITASAGQIAERFSVDVPEFYQPRYNAAPTQLLPVITSAASKGISLFYWGTSPEWSKNKMLSEKIINLSTESFEEKPALKRAMKKSRCIIPADGFYAWKKVGKKTSIPYRFLSPQQELFSFAGLWEEFEDTDGHEIQTFKIITTLAIDTIASFTENMPLILSKETEAIWLRDNCEEEELLNVLKTISPAIQNYPVSPSIANSSQDLASMILPTPPADQHGNLTLFD
jgi:putative SOS response-associated peptidase YedK